MSDSDDSQTEILFQATDDGSMVYRLRNTGKFRKGVELQENDVWISINAPRMTDLERARMAVVICVALNRAGLPEAPSGGPSTQS